MPTFTNKAQLTYNGITLESNTVTGEITTVLSATKTAVDGEYGQSTVITYVVSIVNSGTVPYTELTLTDDLGGYTFGTGTLYPLTYNDGTVLYYQNGVLQPVPTVTAGPPLVITGITVPANGNATVVYSATVNGFAPLDVDSTVTNTATVTGGGLSADLAASETVSAQNQAQLGITKTLSPSTVVENGTVTYTFVIENYGNTDADAADAVAVTDTFDPILSGITVALDGTLWSTPANYTYNTATGAFATVPGQITVPKATFSQDETTGSWTVTPGTTTLTVTGTV